MPRQQLNFSLSDPAALATNAQGALTPDQRSKLTSAALPGLIIGLLCLCILVPMLLMLLYFFLTVPNVGDVIATIMQPSMTLHLGPLTLSISYALCVVGVAFISWAPLILGGLISGVQSLRLLWTHARSQIGCADGLLVWDGAYVARIPGLPDLKRAWYAGPIDLRPGRYRFYFLRGKRWLLSAQWLGPADVAQAATLAAPGAMSGLPPVPPGTRSLLEAIAFANGFSLPALAANRAGYLTPDQVRWALRQHRNEKLAWALLGLLGLVMMGAVGLGFSAGYVGAKSQAGFIFSGIVGGLIALWAGWHVFLARGAYREDAREERVVSLEGFADKDSRLRLKNNLRNGSTYYHEYFYRLEGKEFHVSRQAYDALVVGVPYRFYYLPRSHALVNIEPLSVIQGHLVPLSW
jgi:hypothetical protein